MSLLSFLGIILLLILATEMFYRFFKWPAEQSRKFLHVSGGLMCLLFPQFFDSHWWLLSLAVIAFLVLAITYFYKMLDSIHKTKRRSVGSVIFPIPVYLSFLIAELSGNNLFFYMPISLLTISDTMAETAGNRWGYSGKTFFNGQKTLTGTISFFISSFVIVGCWFYFYHELPVMEVILYSSLLSLATSVTELITLHGWDNLTVPAMTILILYFIL